MRKLPILLLLAILLLPVQTYAVTIDDFRPSSLLSTGTWVKVSVTESGIYEIKFSDLAKMGFDDPARVSVYGHGGRMMNEMFTDASLTITDPCDLQQVPTLTGSDKIYFYARGIEDITFSTSGVYATRGRYLRNNFNVYSRCGYYLLTDSTEPLSMATQQIDLSDDADYYEVSEGIDYCYHEEDLFYNAQNSGRLFWSDTFSTSKKKISYPFSLPDLVPMSQGVLNIEMHYASAQNRTVSGNFRKGGSGLSLTVPATQSSLYTPIPLAYGEVTVPAKTDNLDITFNLALSASRGWLDYWLLTYAKTIPALTAESQSRIRFSSVERFDRYRFAAPTKGSPLCLDISNPKAPTLLPSQEGYFYSRAASAMPQLLIFNTDVTQKKIGSYTTLANTDLHAEAAAGANYLIITTDRFLPYANQLAEAHRAQGTKTMVATIGDIYNEFSSGVPDPMAYRWLIKMLHCNPDVKLRNVLLFGPMVADVRGMIEPRDPEENIIAIQSTSVSRSNGANNCNDVLGIMADYYTADSWSQNVEVGIGLLPVATEAEAKTIVDKTLDYMDRTDFASYLNAISCLACPGDQHMSDNAAIEATERISTYSGDKFIFTPVIADAYPRMEDVRSHWFSSIAAGNLFTFYFGHGDPTGLATSQNLLSAAQISDMKNYRTPFSIFAGCSVTNFDRGVAGIAEKVVLNHNHGSVGAFLSTRETYANENRSIFNYLMQSAFFSEYSTEVQTPRTRPVTIGEIFAAVKTRLRITNEQVYQLMCDPELIVPFPYLGINLASVSQEGAALVVKGEIVDPDRKRVSGFDGEVVLSLLGPATSLLCGNYHSGEVKPLEITYDNHVLHSASYRVSDGTFTARLPLPDLSGYTPDSQFRLAIGAYDPSTRNAAAQKAVVPSLDLAATAIDDATPPEIISFSHNPELQRLEVTASDNVGINLSREPLAGGIAVTLDSSVLDERYISPSLLEDPANGVSLCIALPDLPAGQHASRIRISDLAGNTTSADLVFSVGHNVEKHSLSLPDDFRQGSEMTLLTTLPDGTYTLLVRDASDQEVSRSSVKVEQGCITLSRSQFPAAALYRIILTGPDAYTAPLLLPLL